MLLGNWGDFYDIVIELVLWVLVMRLCGGLGIESNIGGVVKVCSNYK